jgi:hypothetical protein
VRRGKARDWEMACTKVRATAERMTKVRAHEWENTRTRQVMPFLLRETKQGVRRLFLCGNEWNEKI